jgi:hypothetical protein
VAVNGRSRNLVLGVMPEDRDLALEAEKRIVGVAGAAAIVGCPLMPGCPTVPGCVTGTPGLTAEERDLALIAERRDLDLYAE